MKYLKAEIMVGVFMLLGIIAAVVLALQVAGLVLNSDSQTYRVTAKFENIGSLRIRAPIRIGGVLIGRVGAINLDPESLTPVVSLDIQNQFDKISSDSKASIQTAGIIGEHFIQPFDNRCNTGFHTGTYVRTGMKNHDITSTGISAGQLQPEKISGKLVSVRVYSISKIDDIGCMDDKFMDLICLHEIPGSVNI